MGEYLLTGEQAGKKDMAWSVLSEGKQSKLK